MPLNCGVGQESWESLGQQGDPTSQSWIFTGGTDDKAETPILWPPDAESWLIWKDPDAEKDWRWEEKEMTEDETVGWHHRHNGHGFGWTPGVGDEQGGLVCCSSRGHKESDTTEWLHFHFSLSCIGEGNGNPLRYSCLENPGAEPGELPSMGLHRVGHDWSDLAAAAADT